MKKHSTNNKLIITEKQNMKTKLHLLGLLILIISLSGCTDTKQPKNFDYGHIENNTYLNSFFRLELTIPDNWIIQNQEQTENLTKLGKELVAGDDENLKAVLNAAEINTANLLTVFQYELGSTVDYNPNFMLITENLKNAPGTKTGSDYLFQARKLINQSQFQYSHIDDVFEKQVIGNKDFYTMNLSMNYMGLEIKQIYYATVTDRFGLSLIVSYTTEEQKKDLEKMISSIAFSK